MRIVAVGECTRDRYLDRGGETVGGISLNYAVNARRAGAETVALVSCTGTDAGGTAVRDLLAREDVDAGHLHQRPGATATQAVRLVHGERIFPPGGYHPGVLADFHLNDADRAFIAGFDVVAAPCFRQLAHLFDVAMDAARPGAIRVADLLDGADLGPDLAGIDPLLAWLDLVFVSGDELTVDRLLPRSAASRALIVVTQGERGSVALANGRPIREPAVPVPAAERIDTIGCGDAFQAAFTVSWFRDRHIERALRAGALQASRVIRHLGAVGR